MARSRRFLGIDEAGRGPILGPMVVAAVVVDTSGQRRLKRRGVQDSKRFGAGQAARTRRAEVASEIRTHALWCGFEVVAVRTIDAYVSRGGLGALEREVAQRLIESAPAVDRILADGARLFGPLAATFPHLRARNHADACHLSVAAASILAKHIRDREFAAICERYRDDFGVIGGAGYLNAATDRFLASYRQRHGDDPPELRRSWKRRARRPPT